ncbi:MAG: putative GatB/YqeY [Candidatus Saccharibacteria bacterium]|nr:putative GatB/YqeY [Candidatus Saccharibacteria bacterium]
MALKDTIQDDTKAALLSGNRFVGGTLRNLKAAILNEEVAQGKRDTGLSDEEIEKIIAREVKKRNESITLYEANGRPELAEIERKEAEVLSNYLPEQLSEDELRTIVVTKIAELGASGPQAMGQVIGSVKQQVGNTADGATLARIVKENLN